MQGQDFRIVVLTSAGNADPSLAIAACRAGHIGILNAELAPRADAFYEALDRLCASGKGSFGLKVPGYGAADFDWIETAAARGLSWVVIDAGAALEAPERIARIVAAGPRVLLELIDWDDRLADLPGEFGLIVKGHESGGRVGEQTSFILLQKALGGQTRPVFVRGGVGFHSAAAARAGGAAGVVLDDQVLMMRESPVAGLVGDYLARFSGIETGLIEMSPEARWRVFERPGSRQIQGTRTRLAALGFDDAEGQLAAAIGWDVAAGQLAPMGQAATFAPALAARYGSLGRFARALLDESERRVELAARHKVLGRESGVASGHGTPFPIVQGPMTRVSDTAAFAQAVADGGALPMVALALMRAEETETLLAEVQTRLAGKPWGVGLLGFAPSSLIRAQVTVARRHGPNFALIAGGRPDQARELEAEGIPSYLHVPSPRLLTMFLEQGARRFVFEGRECGGHVGPLASFVLWDHMVATLLEQVTDPAVAAEVHVLFAGGVHDARSAAMVAALAAPLAERGVRVGVLIGTAYLFTKEAVEGGGIVSAFQKVALACQSTVTLETGPGHASRAATSPFADEFLQLRRRMEADGRGADEIRDALEDLTLGRLRVATKAQERAGPNGDLRKVPLARQKHDGMYMIGQAATLRDQVITIADLHREVSEGSQALLNQRVAGIPPAAPRVPPRPADIAIIGVSALLPNADNARVYWENILDRVNAIREIPADRWDHRLYFDEDRNAKDKIYSRWGGFLDDLLFDPFVFGIPPRAISAIDPLQLMTLEVGRRCLEDAGYAESTLKRDRASVILGASGGAGDVGAQYAVRAEMTRFLGGLDPEAASLLPEWTEDSFAGILLNVAAGRSANRFDFGGVNYTIDAACASSLAAVYQGVLELESGRSDLVIAGGIDTVQGPFGYLCFSKTQALSPRGRCGSFEASADGIVISEGIAMVALKRLADAERDGDRIYSVIKGVGGSSDGRAKSMTAPHPDGQIRALTRAYDMAGYSPTSVALFEAHGTGTVAGDTAELETVTRLLTAAGAGHQHSAIGSVKTMIGHTKATAGIAGIIKAALACYHGVLPPHGRRDAPNARLREDDTRLYLVDQPLPWMRDGETPRRAGISSFGFGGTNFHVTLEEYDGARAIPTLREAPRQRWSHELLVWRASDRAALATKLRGLAAKLVSAPRPNLRDLACALAGQLPRDGITATLVIGAEDALGDRIAALAEHLEDAHKPLPPGAAFSERPLLNDDGRLALIFPGQGAQYPDMFCELATLFGEMQDTLARADAVLAEVMAEKGAPAGKLSRVILPVGSYDAEARKAAAARLTRTDFAQPALGAVEAGLLRLLGQFGLRADMAAGHSYGEFVALHAAGVLGLDDLLRVSEARGRFMVEAAEGGDLGTMAAAQARRAQVETLIEGVEGLCIANHNAPLQTILSGTRAAITAATARFEAEGLTVHPLAVGAAFHSPIVEPARERLATYIASLPIASPRFPVYANSTAGTYPNEPAAIRDILSSQLALPVEFVAEVEAMYAAGARVFVNVGPRTTHSSLVRQILADRPHRTIATDDDQNGLGGLLTALGALLAEGAPLDLGRLWAGRDCQALDLATLGAGSNQSEPAAHMWLLNGGGARRVGDPPRRILTVEDVAKRKAATQDVAAKAVAASSVANGALVAMPQRPVVEWNEAAANGMPRSYKITESNMREVVMEQVYQDGHESEAAPPLDYYSTTERQSVLADFQATMARFLTTQETVMLAYMGGGDRRPARAPQRLLPAPLARKAVPLAPVEQAGRRDAFVAHRNGAAHKPAANGAANGALSNGATNGHANGAGHGLTNGAANGKAATSAPTPTEQPAVVAAAPVVAIVATATPVAAPVAVAAPKLDAAQLLDLVLGLVEERTGYPRDMLGIDQSIEADLGIDSIKRVEIIGALLKTLPSGAQQAASDLGETLNEQKTLRAIVDKLSERLQTAVEVAARPFDQAGVEKGPVQTRTAQPRFVIRAQAEPLPAAAKAPLPAGRYLITDDGAGVATALAGLVTAAGGLAVVLDAEALLSDAGLAATVQADAPVAALVHLAPLAASALGAEPAAWRAQIERNEKLAYRLARAHAGHLRQGRIVFASALGGFFGRTADNIGGLRATGGGVGLAKSLREEWQDCRAKAVDLDPRRLAWANAEHLFQELACAEGRAEVGYPAGVRTVFRTEAAPLAGDILVEPGPDWVVLATGGARGITAEVLRPLAARGVTLVLLGRSPLPKAEPAELARLTGAADLRRHFVEAAKAAGLAITPVAVAARVAAVTRDREIRANLKAFEALGSKVSYVAVDVGDADALGAVLGEIYDRYGRIDGVLHGAGVIEDRLLVDKSPESWSRVVETKLVGAFALANGLRPAGLKFLSFFASVAGRYGNSGQTDYAAANEMLNRLAWQLSAAWGDGVKVTAINWGPWLGTQHGVGMVSDETRKKFEAKGVRLVEPEGGADAFLAEIMRGSRADVEIILGEGPWERHEATIGAFSAALGGASAGARPLLNGSRPAPGPRGGSRIQRVLSLDSDPYLDEHRLAGVPVLPLAVALEMAAEAVADVWTDWQVIEVSGLRMLSAIRLESAAPYGIDISVTGGEHGDSDGFSAKVQLSGSGDSGRPHYRASVHLASAPSATLPSLRLINPAASAITARDAYRDVLFHGPSYQAMTRLVGLDRTGVVAEVRPSSSAHFGGGGWLFDPGLVDTAAQLAWLWSHQLRGMAALPNGIARARRFREPGSGPLRMALSVRPESGDKQVLADVVVQDSEGRAVMILEGLESTADAALNRFCGWSGEILS